MKDLVKIVRSECPVDTPLVVGGIYVPNDGLSYLVVLSELTQQAINASPLINGDGSLYQLTTIGLGGEYSPLMDRDEMEFTLRNHYKLVRVQIEWSEVR